MSFMTKIDKYELLLFLLGSIYVILCPFTKVEESFNTQAVHDILIHKINLSKYDHHLFPGPVPRTFIGSLVLSYCSMPLFYLCYYAFKMSKLYGIYMHRIYFVVFQLIVLKFLRYAVNKKYGKLAGQFLIIVSLVQFHYPFYMSRLLPNCYAMLFSSLAFGFLILDQYFETIIFLAFGTLVFRCDMVLLAFPICLWILVKCLIEKKQKLLFQVILSGISASICSILMTTIIDSIFWGRLLWPEYQVLHFNTVQNKSSEWGVSPWYWYFTSAIPRMLLFTLIFIPCALFLQKTNKFIDQKILLILTPVLSFVLLYSFLPHKETRFLFPILPGFNILAAVGAAKCQNDFYKNKLVNLFLKLMSLGALIGSLALAFFFFYVSFNNYPSGYALKQYNENFAQQGLNTHIDVFSAQSGISLWLHQEDFKYSKKENLADQDLLAYDFLITERQNITGFHQVYAEKGYKRIDFKKLSIEYEERVFILKKNQK